MTIYLDAHQQTETMKPIRLTVGAGIPIIVRNTDPASKINPQYTDAKYSAECSSFYNGHWYRWTETDPNAPMIPPQFRKP